MDLDLNDCRGDMWSKHILESLDNVDNVNKLRKFVRKFKRSGGDDGKPGDYEGLFDRLFEMIDDPEAESENKEYLTELLEGETEEGWSTF